ncbi:unnamed protein product [Lota lota]
MAVGPDVIIFMLAWVSQVFSEIDKLPAPVNVNVTSSNFIYLLTWQPGPGTPRGVSYNVSVSSDRDLPWVPVAGCVLVKHPLVCNLTGAFANPTDVYYSRVVAILRSQASPLAFSPGFKPLKDGELPLPLLTLALCDHFLCVDLHPPLERVRGLYQGFQYQLRITSITSSQPVEFLVSTRSLDRYVLKDLAPGREYCVSVRIWDSQIPREFVFSPPTCTSTPTRGVRAADVILGALCLGVVLMVAFVFLLVRTGALCLKKPLPSVLIFINPLGEERLAIPRKEPDCSHIHAMVPSAGWKGKCAVSVGNSVGHEEVSTSGSAESVGEYELPFNSSSTSSSSSSSSFSTRPLLAPPFKSEGPPLSQEHVNPHMCTHLATFSPACRRSELQSELRANAFKTLRSVAVATEDQHALQLPCSVDPLAPSLDKEAEAREESWGGCDDVNLLSLTFGDRVEDRATLPPTTEEEEVSMETVISVEDEAVDEEQPDGYLRR